VAGFQTDDQRVFLEEKDARSHAHYLRFVQWCDRSTDGSMGNADDFLAALKSLRDAGFITFAEGWEP
jgi:hypothetical protein